MRKRLMLLLFFLPCLFAGTETATKEDTVEFILKDLGLKESLRLYYGPSGTLMAVPILDRAGQDRFLKRIEDQLEWKEDSPKRAVKKGAMASYRQRKTGIGSLHASLFPSTDGTKYFYELHVDWYYSGKDHPFSTFKHLFGECIPHRVFRAETSQAHLLSMLKRKSNTAR